MNDRELAEYLNMTPDDIARMYANNPDAMKGISQLADVSKRVEAGENVPGVLVDRPRPRRRRR